LFVRRSGGAEPEVLPRRTTVIAIRPGESSDQPAIENLLLSAGLPTVGLEAAMGSAVVAEDGGILVGCAAVEVYGPAGLLRSVCVAPKLRGTGMGHTLVEAAEASALQRGVTELFLLTETAFDWFPRLGYVRDRRDVAPAALQASPEFTGACPDNAVLMRKRLAGAPPLQ
jgi:N-acetylglutamate synthase-like GNAT family acetyltransferase